MNGEGIDGLTFADARELGVHGRAFADTGRFYSRLPAAAEGRVRPAVWDLAQMAAGITVEFVSDTSVLAAELELEDDPECPQPGLECSIDCYVHDGRRWGWFGVLRNLVRPLTRDFVCSGLPREPRRFRIHLPYAARVASLRLGIEPDAMLEPVPVPDLQPICFYGTSIVHGYCASRSGMTFPAILSRRMEWPVWNLGFAGNALMDQELPGFFGTLAPSVYVIDCLPNMEPELVAERTGPFVRALRAAGPDTPILLVENVVYQATHMLQDRRTGWGPKNDALRREYEKLLDAGMAELHYLSGEHLLGDDGEGTVDGTHPTDLGFVRMADAFEPVLRRLLDAGDDRP